MAFPIGGAAALAAPEASAEDMVAMKVEVPAEGMVKRGCLRNYIFCQLNLSGKDLGLPKNLTNPIHTLMKWRGVLERIRRFP